MGAPLIAAEEVARRVSAVLGVPITAVDPVPCFAANQVFRVRADDRTLFLKLADAAAVRAEVGVLDLLRGRAVPAPEVAASDMTADRFGRPGLLLRDVGGAPLDGSEAAFVAAGAHLRAVHAIEVQGFGSVYASDRGLHADHATWSEAILDRCSGITAVVDADLVAGALVERAMTFVSTHDRMLAGVTSGRLLHGDFHPRHVFALDARVSGIIDWGDATAGDPIYDLGRVFHSGVMGGSIAQGSALLTNLLRGYGAPNVTPVELRTRVRLYAVVFTLWSMIGEHAGGSPWPPWWPAQIAALSAILDDV